MRCIAIGCRNQVTCTFPDGTSPMCDDHCGHSGDGTEACSKSTPTPEPAGRVEMPELPWDKCPNCTETVGKYEHRKYGGYCFQCWNTGADELAGLRVQLARLQAENATLKGPACTGTCERCKLKIRTAEYHDSDGLFCEPCHQLNEVQAERDELRKDVEGLNRMLREHGYGQGQIDCYVQTAEELDEAVGLLDGCRAVLSQVENDAWTTNTLTYGRARQVQAQMNTVAAFLARIRAASQEQPQESK